METPEYFICTSDEAKGNVKEYKERGIVNRYALNADEFKNKWEKLEI